MNEKCEPGDISPQLNSLDCWDYSIELECLRGPEDLQLAAELGKTLLERNKELETSLKQHQNIIEDQTQEIEYLTKQTVALREVNDSRLRIYEQLEVSIHDLERANHRLTLDSAADKKQIKSLLANVDVLEARCDELQASVEQLTSQLESYKRKCERIETADHGAGVKMPRPRSGELVSSTEMPQDKQVQCDSTTKPEFLSRHAETSTSPLSSLTRIAPANTIGVDTIDGRTTEGDQMNVVLEQLRDIKSQRSRDQRRVVELEEQLATLVQENQALETQLLNASTRDEHMKSMHDELNTLDEVRQGQLCSRCLRNVEDRMTGDDISILDTEEEDDDNLSMMDALISETRYRSSVSLNIQQDNQPLQTPATNNLYRDLVEKYEALLAVNRNHHKPASNCMSLQDELRMSSGDFNNVHCKDTDEESGHGDSLNINFDKHKSGNNRKAFSQTPTDFSEAETSSSGFADETSNKSTQTDGRPGSFLCTIADGEDCKFSIYDDASPIDSRFRNRPEYRELFKEIFTVLKKAAENKDEGEDLPLLDDCTPIVCMPKVPPVTPATEDFPCDFNDDNQSVISSAMSDISTHSIEPTTVVENPITVKENEKPVEENTKQVKEEKEIKHAAPVLTPLRREPLEYLQVSVNVRKKSASKKKKQFADRSDSPVLPLSPRISYLSNGAGNRKKKDFRPTPDGKEMWNGNTLQFWSTNRNVASPTPSQMSGKNRQEKNSWEFKPSPASQDLNKLKRLDLSYAEVLRNADNKKRESYAKNVRRK